MLEVTPKKHWVVLSGLLLLTLGSLFVHGYHPFAEDAEIYLPGVEKVLHPELYPVGSEFFQPYARLSFFPNLIAASVRITHLPLETVLFLWHAASIFLLLLACWQLSMRCFSNPAAAWASTALVAALLTLPVAGTALYLMDQYLNPRNIAAFAGVFGVLNVLERRYWIAALWLGFAAAMHPFMAFFTISFCCLLTVMQTGILARVGLAGWAAAFSVPSSVGVDPYHEAAMYHSFHFLWHWAWYEWLGAIAPVGLFLWFAHLASKDGRRELRVLCRAFAIYNLIYLAGALALLVPWKYSETLTRFQPMRSLHLLYIVMLVVGGGYLAQYALKNQVWRWLALFVPMSVGMFLGQRSLFPGSVNVEWPGIAPKNEWEKAFLWIRDNTPVDAVFALDPWAMKIPNEDANGFRSIAQRSMLADAIKDSGAVSMFPGLADKWWTQVQAQAGWQKFQLQDFEKLRAEYGVTWVVVSSPGISGLDCPYHNRSVRVCRLEPREGRPSGQVVTAE